ncbi:DUF3995 domain-containing protein [Streptomyces sp. NPDC005251]|uniref:DUF3995 domain-containing protein n=1 Tax=Streptomyces sp. NPDC005251 TaxID=3157166 RepID=UPI0033B5AD2A
MSLSRKPVRPWGYAACLWALIFAAAHFYWAVGGDVGLSVSAGRQLATTRPLLFVVLGLWCVGALCLVGALLPWLLAASRPRGATRLILKCLCWGIGFILLMRGISVEFLLLTDVTHLDGNVSSGQRFWTLVLWNPWFVAGGLAFGMSAMKSGSRDRSPLLRADP